MSIAFPAEVEIVPADQSDGQSDVPGRTLLSLVIPVRDAAASLPSVLNAITRWIAPSDVAIEVVVVDDGSCDGTRATASSFERRIANLQVLRHVERRGRLEAIRTGERAACGELIAFGRAQDLERSLEACPELVAAVRGGAALAVLPTVPGRPVTPVVLPPARNLKDSCFGWIRRKISRSVREPELVVCRAETLRRLLAAAQPGHSITDEAAPDWLALARRTGCPVSFVRREPPAELPRLQTARTA
jgi:hypothetical protein